MNASAHRAKARTVLRGNWATAVLAAFLVGLLSGSLANPQIKFDLFYPLPIWLRMPDPFLIFLCDQLHVPLQRYSHIIMLVLAAGSLLSGVMALGYARYSLNLIDGREAKLGHIFSGIPRFREALVMHLLRMILEALGFCLFLVPGLVLSLGFSMAPFLLAEDPACTGREALRRSWAMMRGRKLELLRLELSFIGWILLSGVSNILTTIGLFVDPYRMTALASFYRELSQASEA